MGFFLPGWSAVSCVIIPGNPLGRLTSPEAFPGLTLNVRKTSKNDITIVTILFTCHSEEQEHTYVCSIHVMWDYNTHTASTLKWWRDNAWYRTTYTHTYIHTNTLTHTYTSTLKHTHTHLQTQTHIYSHIHTHTHTYIHTLTLNS